MKAIRTVLCLLSVLLMPASPCHADFATPFLEIHNQEGEVSTAHGYIVAFAPETDSKFLVIVRTDTLDHKVLHASAKPGVLDPSLLGRWVVIKARIAKARKGPAKPELEILGAEAVKPVTR